MRSTLATLILGISLVAGCEVGDAGGGGGGGGGGDDTGGGGADAAVGETPKLAVTVDKATINTELMSSNQITVTLTSTGGFSGPVTLTPSVVDSASAPVTGWTAGLNMTSVNVPENGTASAVLTLTIPSNTGVLAGTVKIDASSSLGAQSVSSTVTAANRVTISVKNNGLGQCVYPTGMTSTTIKLGATLRFINTATIAGDVVRIHMDENAANTSGLKHEQADIIGTATYDQVPTGVDADGVGWYCHTPGNNPGNLKIIVAP